MFLLKKIIGLLCMPLSVAGLLLVAGLVLSWFGKSRKLAGVLLLLGTMMAMGFASSPVADRLLTPLELRYEPVTSAWDLADVRFVVVLGGGHRSDPRLTATMQLSDASLARLIEGIRLHRQLPESVLIFTGGAIFDAFSHAWVMAAAAGELGELEPKVLLDQPRDTAEEMLALREVIAADEPFLLVTSASHMPRSVALAKAAGLAPVPAPTDFLVKQSLERERHPGDYFPSAVALRRSERAVYEYLGLIWTEVREAPRLRRIAEGKQ
ncbi:ElyC/SanA/YdcF family protein [Desulfonatronum thiodismutans]|uniref:ElyC/SanA/YdcF family protein n=1 Tax=Desulfonatronum thiodismutans TaxID=159290 RepID=UPI0004ABE6F8|nr:ElyC/SanA/YdcF family protein [Desulfonatronum thiodismutans]